MIIEPIIGIQKRNSIISEREFQRFSIFSTEQLLREYFNNYGYHFVDFYDIDKNLIVVKNSNPELSILLANFDLYQVIDFKTRKVVIGNFDIKDLKNSNLSFRKNIRTVSLTYAFTYSIIEEDNKMRLESKSTSNTILTAEKISFITPDLLLVTNYGLESIFSLIEMSSYPLIKTEEKIYYGKMPEKFLDMRNCMYTAVRNTIHPIFLDFVDLRELVEKYPYGQHANNKFQLLDFPLCHGIFYENGETTFARWYAAKEDRDSVLDKLGIAVTTVLEEEKQKIKKD